MGVWEYVIAMVRVNGYCVASTSHHLSRLVYLGPWYITVVRAGIPGEGERVDKF
jgi:hypothetical protein